MKERTKKFVRQFLSTLGTAIAGIGVSAFAKKLLMQRKRRKMQIRLNQAFQSDFGSDFGENCIKYSKVQESLRLAEQHS